MDRPLVIDKDYVFYAVGSGMKDEVRIHIQCDHDEAMMYGECFSDDDSEREEHEDDEIGIEFDIKDRLDETLATEFADRLFQEWEDNHDDDDQEIKTIDDFYDEGWENVSVMYYYYCWSPEFKKDCIDYYQKNKQS